jgi:hypothetical protein
MEFTYTLLVVSVNYELSEVLLRINYVVVKESCLYG